MLEWHPSRRPRVVDFLEAARQASTFYILRKKGKEGRRRRARARRDTKTETSLGWALTHWVRLGQLLEHMTCDWPCWRHSGGCSSEASPVSPLR